MGFNNSHAQLVCVCLSSLHTMLQFEKSCAVSGGFYDMRSADNRLIATLSLDLKGKRLPGIREIRRIIDPFGKPYPVIAIDLDHG